MLLSRTELLFLLNNISLHVASWEGGGGRRNKGHEHLPRRVTDFKTTSFDVWTNTYPNEIERLSRIMPHRFLMNI